LKDFAQFNKVLLKSSLKYLSLS